MLKQLLTFGANEGLVAALANHGARFLVVGGVAVRYHVPDRIADDLDLLIDPTITNARKVIAALGSVHIGGKELTARRLARLNVHMPVKALGFYTDILTSKKWGQFSRDWKQAEEAILGGTVVKVASIKTLLARLSGSTEPSTCATWNFFAPPLSRPRD